MTLKKTIYNILLNNPETRNSDKKLIWEVWRIYMLIDFNEYITEESFMSAPSPESIRRCRQALQRSDLLSGAKLIQPNEIVKKNRVKLSKSKGYEYQQGRWEFDQVTNSYKEL